MAFRPLLVLSAICAIYKHAVNASGTYIVALDIPNGSITSFTGNVQVPTKPETGPLYIGAGIEDSEQNNSLAMRLDGSANTNDWNVYATWESHGVNQSSQGSFPVSAGETVNYNLTYAGSNWIAILTTDHDQTTSQFNLGMQTP